MTNPTRRNFLGAAGGVLLGLTGLDRLVEAADRKPLRISDFITNSDVVGSYPITHSFGGNNTPPQIAASPMPIQVPGEEPRVQVFSFPEAYQTYIQGLPEAVRTFEEQYAQLARQQSLEIYTHKDGNRFLALKQNGQQLISEGEHAAIQKLYDLSSLQPKPLQLEQKTINAIQEKPDDFFKELVQRAQRSTYGKHVTSDLSQQAQQALNSTSNKANILRGMSAMTEDALVIALHNLVLMAHPEYGFAHSPGAIQYLKDIDVYTPEQFHEVATTAADVLNNYSWAKEQAQRDWNGFMHDTATLRTFFEHVGGTRHLFNVAKTLMEGAQTLDDAVERLASFLSKVISPSGSERYKSQLRSNPLRSLLAHEDSEPDVRKAAILLGRLAGLRIGEAYTKWFADGEGGATWTMVRHRLPDGWATYSFSAGMTIINAKKQTHVYDSRKGVPGLIEAYFSQLTAKGREFQLVTDACTTTTQLATAVDPQSIDQEVTIAVYNNGFKLTQLKEKAKGDNPVVEYPTVGSKEVYEGSGLLALLFDGQRFASTPLIIRENGMHEPLKIWAAVGGGLPRHPVKADLEPNTDYELLVFGVHPQDGQIKWLKLRGPFRSDDKGNVQLPMVDKTLCVLQKPGSQEGHAYHILEENGSLVAYKH